MVQFFGFLFFLFMALSGFWCLTFLAHVAIGWVMAGPLETFGIIGKKSSEEDKRQILPKQEGVEVLFTKEA